MKKFCLVIVSTVFSVIFMVSPTYAQESETELFGPRVEQEYVQDYVQIQPRFAWRGSVWRTNNTGMVLFVNATTTRPSAGPLIGNVFTVVSDVSVTGRVALSGLGSPTGAGASPHWWAYIGDIPSFATRVSDGW